MKDFMKFVKREYGYTEDQFKKLSARERSYIWEDYLGNI